MVPNHIQRSRRSLLPTFSPQASPAKIWREQYSDGTDTIYVSQDSSTGVITIMTNASSSNCTYSVGDSVTWTPPSGHPAQYGGASYPMTITQVNSDCTYSIDDGDPVTAVETNVPDSQLS